MDVRPRAVDLPVWAVVSDARVRAGLSRSDLAALAQMREQVVASYERARAIPPADILNRLLRVCERELRARVDPYDWDNDEELIEFRLSLTPEERVRLSLLLSELERGASSGA